jgi:putative Ca2+/H+ antiporter (TMEM165/GDT1 family)
MVNMLAAPGPAFGEANWRYLWHELVPPDVSLFCIKEPPVTAFLLSMSFVVLAEMGDKTQLLAMAFASRYRPTTVLWAVFWATLLNHLFAVIAGNYLTKIVPIHYIQVAAAVSFILFGLWTIRGDKLHDEDKGFCFSPFWTVAIAFFLAEMGDKTQLATVALAAKYQSVVPVWMGTTTGMIIADAIGIAVGICVGKKIPEVAVKWFAAVVFMFFGFKGLHQYLPESMLTTFNISAAVLFVGAAAFFIARPWKS